MKKSIFFLLLITLATGCQKRSGIPPQEPRSASGGQQTQVPEEPIQQLAWLSAQRMAVGLHRLGEDSLATGQIGNLIGWPAQAQEYFLSSFQNYLKTEGINISTTSEVTWKGTLFKRNGNIVFAFQVTKSILNTDSSILSDSASIAEDARLQNTLAQFEPHHMHQHTEVEIPTPLAQLAEAPLDLSAACKDSNCFVLLLYADHLEILNWKTGERRSIPFATRFYSALRSRDPSGKILRFGDGYILLQSNFTSPLYISADLNDSPGVLKQKPEWLPLPEPTVNFFSLKDGHFYDFEIVEGSGIVAVDTGHHLNLAKEGNLASSTITVGDTLCIARSTPRTTIYTSSAGLSQEADSVLKFTYIDSQSTSLEQESSRTVDGEILDLALTDLNQDQESELLVTLRNSRGILIEVMEPF